MGYKIEKNQHMGYDKRQYLLGGFNHLEKYYIVHGKDYPIYYANISQWEGLFYGK